jgi:hypothetical protein
MSLDRFDKMSVVEFKGFIISKVFSAVHSELIFLATGKRSLRVARNGGVEFAFSLSVFNRLQSHIFHEDYTVLHNFLMWLMLLGEELEWSHTSHFIFESKPFNCGKSESHPYKIFGSPGVPSNAFNNADNLCPIFGKCISRRFQPPTGPSPRARGGATPRTMLANAPHD